MRKKKKEIVVLQNVRSQRNQKSRISEYPQYHPDPDSPVNCPLIVISVGATRVQGLVLSPGLGQAPIPCDAKTRLTALDPPIVGAAKYYRDTP